MWNWLQKKWVHRRSQLFHHLYESPTKISYKISSYSQMRKNQINRNGIFSFHFVIFILCCFLFKNIIHYQYEIQISDKQIIRKVIIKITKLKIISCYQFWSGIGNNFSKKSCTCFFCSQFLGCKKLLYISISFINKLWLNYRRKYKKKQ